MARTQDFDGYTLFFVTQFDGLPVKPFAEVKRVDRRVFPHRLAEQDGAVEAAADQDGQLGLVARACPSATLIGVDPDAAIRQRARAKLAGVAPRVELLAGYARDSADLLRGRGVTKVLSSLVFHQVPLEEKRAGLAAIYQTLPSGGSLHVADYGLQRTAKMRKRFRLVQKGDGYDVTEPNARGVLPELMTDVGFDSVDETHVFETITGSISIYRAVLR